MLGVLVRDSGVWTYAILNLGHILGISTLFGSILILDLHLLGFGPRASMAAVSRLAIPLAKAGFALAAVSGTAMLATNATEYVDNPFLLIKFPAIAVGLVNVAVISRLPEWRARGDRELTARERRRLSVLGGVSLASWVTAVMAGRMIGYW